MIDPDKTQKIPVIKRTPTREQKIARESRQAEIFEQQLRTARERLAELGVEVAA